MYDKRFMELAIEQAQRGAEADEVPVGAVAVKDGKVLAACCNMKELRGDATQHAEMLALKGAAEALGNWWLEGCELYVTLEPCPMCAGAMINARISALYFGAYDKKAGACGSKVNLLEEGLFNHNVEYSGGYEEQRCATLLSDFFAKKRVKPSNSDK